MVSEKPASKSRSCSSCNTIFGTFISRNSLASAMQRGLFMYLHDCTINANDAFDTAALAALCMSYSSHKKK